MKKILGILAVLMIFASIAAVTAQPINKIMPLDPTGSFSGFIGVPKQQDPIILGNISGEYRLRNRGGGFIGNWDIAYQNKTASGTIRGLFGRHIMLGKLTIEGVNRSLPIIGFIKFDVDNLTFGGRAMSFIGPALYFWGTYQPY